MVLEVLNLDSKIANSDLKRNGSSKKTNTHVQSSTSTGQANQSTLTSPKYDGKESNELTFLQEDSPAKTSATPEPVQELKKGLDQVFGLNTSVPFAHFDQKLYLWKTYQHSLVGDSTLFLATWPRSGTMRNGIAYPRVPLARLTEETESGLLPTPRTTDVRDGRIMNEKGQRTNKEGTMVYGANLSDVVQMWPTPTTQEVEHQEMELTESNRRKTKDGKDSHSIGLADAVKMWPTPVARDWKGKSSGYQKGKDLSALVEPKEGKGGQLNPVWVEWLMGFPLAWTELSASETQLYRKSRIIGQKKSKKD